MALNTGLHRGELLGLTWDRVDMSRGGIRLELTKAVGETEPGATHAKDPRGRPMSRKGERRQGSNGPVARAVGRHRG